MAARGQEPRDIPGYFYDPETKRYYKQSPHPWEQKKHSALYRCVAGREHVKRNAPKKNPEPRVSQLVRMRQSGLCDPAAMRRLLWGKVCRGFKDQEHYNLGPGDMGMEGYRATGANRRPQLTCESNSKALDFTYMSVNFCPYVLPGPGLHPRPMRVALTREEFRYEFQEELFETLGCRFERLVWKPRHRNLINIGESSYSGIGVTNHLDDTMQFNTFRFKSSGEPSQYYECLDRWSKCASMHAPIVDIVWHSHEEAYYAANLHQLYRFEPEVPPKRIYRCRRSMSCVRYCDRYSCVFIGFANGTIGMLDERSPKPCVSFLSRKSGNSRYIQNISFLHGEEQLIVASFGGQLELWDSRSPSDCVVVEYSDHVNDGQYDMNIAIHGHSVLAAHGTDDAVRFWDLLRPSPIGLVKVRPNSGVCFPRWHTNNPRSPESFLSCWAPSREDLSFQWYAPKLS